MILIESHQCRRTAGPREPTGNPLTADCALALDAIVIGLGPYLLSHNSVTTAVVTLVLAFMGLVATALHLLMSTLVARIPSLRMLGEIDLGISIAGTVLVAGDLGILLS